MKVRWRESAGHDLREIRAYIAQDNPVAARKVIKDIRRQVAVLSRNPLIGRAGQVPGTHELVISRYPYVAAYQVKGKAVEILAVIHTSRLWPDVF
ncbi:MAG: type II toxin-antitoxin system RelE/ParE family toxin [Betaproteobacteria bacterium]|nr:type II toxin-antitoxin system RelE/ParE family toxin [Betaproteobacteria bacterium]